MDSLKRISRDYERAMSNQKIKSSSSKNQLQGHINLTQFFLLQQLSTYDNLVKVITDYEANCNIL